MAVYSSSQIGGSWKDRLALNKNVGEVAATLPALRKHTIWHQICEMLGALQKKVHCHYFLAN